VAFPHFPGNFLHQHLIPWELLHAPHFLKMVESLIEFVDFVVLVSVSFQVLPHIIL
jgi:hypothetical protein